MSDPTPSVVLPEDAQATAWWIQIGDDQLHACFDVPGRGTVSIEITDASFGGEIHD